MDANLEAILAVTRGQRDLLLETYRGIGSE